MIFQMQAVLPLHASHLNKQVTRPSMTQSQRMLQRLDAARLRTTDASPSMCVIGAWFVLITQLDLYLYEYTHW